MKPDKEESSEEPKRKNFLDEDVYGVCSECGVSLGKYDVGVMHSICERSKFGIEIGFNF